MAQPKYEFLHCPKCERGVQHEVLELERNTGDGDEVKCRACGLVWFRGARTSRVPIPPSIAAIAALAEPPAGAPQAPEPVPSAPTPTPDAPAAPGGASEPEPGVPKPTPDSPAGQPPPMFMGDAAQVVEVANVTIEGFRRVLIGALQLPEPPSPALVSAMQELITALVADLCRT